MLKEVSKKADLGGIEVMVLRGTERFIPYLQKEINFMKKYGFLKETDRVAFSYRDVKPPLKKDVLVWRGNAVFATYNLNYIKAEYYKLFASTGIPISITLDDNPREILLKMKYRNKFDVDTQKSLEDYEYHYYGRF